MNEEGDGGFEVGLIPKSRTFWDSASPEQEQGREEKDNKQNEDDEDEEDDDEKKEDNNFIEIYFQPAGQTASN